MTGKFACRSMSSLLAILACATSAKAQTVSFEPGGDIHGWWNVGPTEPGAWSLAVDPLNDGTIYVPTVGGGVRKSIDYGQTWTSVDSGLSSRDVFSIGEDTAGTLYAGVFAFGATYGVFTSGDGGASWTSPQPDTIGTIPLSLSADPTIPGVAYVGGFFGSLLKTVDGGATWTTSYAGNAPIASIDVDPTNSDTIYLSTAGAAVRRSTDGGGSWMALSNLNSSVAWAIAIDPTQTNIIYAATNEDGVWQSCDYGDTWQFMGSPGGVPWALAVDPATPTDLYAATDNGVWKSSDRGVTWQPTSLTKGGFKIIVLPTLGTSTLYVGTTLGADVSYDGGTTWTDLDPGEGGSHSLAFSVTTDPIQSGKVFVATLGSTVLLSTNGGTSWQTSGDGYSGRSVRAIAVDPTDSSRVYAGSVQGGGVFKSVDGGSTWSRHALAGPAVYTWVTAVDPVSPNIVYAGTRGDGLYRSNDYGETWTHVAGIPANVSGIAVDPSNDKHIFVATTVGLFKSLNGGLTWTNVLSQNSWNVTIVNPGPNAVLYDTGNGGGGVFRSTDYGDTWQAINNGITNRQIGREAGVIADPANSQILYVGSEGGGGVYKSTNGGDLWYSVNLGLTDLGVTGLAMDAVDNRTLYVSGGSGIFKTTTGGE